MITKIPTPSKKTFAAFVMLSVVLHLAVCKLPVQSSISHEELNENIIQVSLVSVAAPAVIGNAAEDTKKNKTKEIAKIEPAAGAGAMKMDKKSDHNKKKQILTSNNTGKDLSTIEPMLGESDYIQTVAPVYPPRAIERGQQGVVIVRAFINGIGQAEKVLIHDSSGFNILDESAVKAVSNWKFKNSAISKAEGMWVQVPVKFIIR